MKFLNQLREGERINDIYLCRSKQSAVTKNGKPYDNLTITDRTASLNAKVWEPTSEGIEDYEELDYIQITGDVLSYQGALQVSIKRLKRARKGDYNPADYLPVSERDEAVMRRELAEYIESVRNPFLHTLLNRFFTEDSEFLDKFCSGSAAKQIHHGFVGGLLEHTLAVTKLCTFFADNYPILNHDLLVTASLLHDIGKVRELSAFPQNDYTDEGQLVGHIVIGAEMITRKASGIEDFPPQLLAELTHCILAHHGEFEFGSPKKPALVEALALNLADNTDARMEMMKELFLSYAGKTGWLGYQRQLESNVRKTGDW